MRDRGQALMLVLAVGALLAVSMVAMGRFGARVLTVEQAQVAADAAALAGVVDGRAAAAALARRNGGTLVAFTAEGADVIVVVSVGDERATARASRAP
jgi:hypothetical protein